MKRRMWGVAFAPALLALAACGGAGEENKAMSEQSDHASQTEATRALAMQFLQRAFIEKDFRGAYNAFAAPDFIQHNPTMGDGLAAHKAHFDAMQKQWGSGTADWAHVTDMVLADGDIFAVLHHVFRSPDDAGQIVADLWRVKDGKIVEHWDVIQQMPKTMPHKNGMGCGTANDFASAKAHEDSVVNPTCGVPDPKSSREASLKYYHDYVGEVAKGDVIGAIEKWIHPDYKQHSPIIADGKQGAIDYLKEEWGRADAPKPVLGPQRIVADGDYVLVHYMYRLEGVPGEEAHIDIFRFTDGKMSEHWDVKQKVPETSANKNGMW